MRAHHARSKIDDIRKKMSDLPELQADEIHLSNKESIAILAHDIATLRERGYGFEQIVEFLRENDFEITSSTLKTYLREPERKRENTPIKNKKTTKKPTTENKKVTGVTAKNAIKIQTKKKTTKGDKNQAEFLIAPDRDVL
ncbi:hypothetical protein [Acetobacter cerevisiae]|uniref:Uncharacterized protein n=1 Tax=Acetobacter cerevisiae TaxID=178900 RepID=A0A149VEW3_9PROT|nr:hypothetical protein [Acetobacter cerevisiae]KXV78666.1 hypothetical protein AD954_01605 [Acetobacter cerevisiae]